MYRHFFFHNPVALEQCERTKKKKKKKKTTTTTHNNNNSTIYGLHSLNYPGPAVVEQGVQKAYALSHIVGRGAHNGRHELVS